MVLVEGDELRPDLLATRRWIRFCSIADNQAFIKF